ncbi:MAG: hypothetical protein HZA21_04325 [Nitrospirae bacterium]|nr:hypothetical protein [Nitrospirota bacterium]
MKAIKLFGLVMLVAFLAAGCAGTREVQVGQQATMYSSMDATALVYSDPAAAAQLNDHPLRWVGFALNPLGVAADYAINRPFYALASTMPGLFGYTSEDAMLDAQRLGIRR